MIIAKELSKIFETKDKRVVAVDEIDLHIEKGRVVGLLGPNGAGKTTTIRMLSTVYRPTSGGAVVAGHDILDDPLAVRQSIGMSTETPTLYPKLTAKRNMQYFADLYGVNKSQRDFIIDGLLKKFNLIDVKDQNVSTFSKGMKQKLSLVKALLHDPEILMLDEPWSGLSPEATRDLRKLIADLADDKRTILISTHNLAQAELVVDQLIIINKGKIIIDTTPDKLRKKFAVKPIVRMRLDTYEGLEDKLSSVDYVENIEKSNNHVNFHINSFENTPDLISHLVSEKVRIHTVREEVPSLEDIYLQLIDQEEER